MGVACMGSAAMGESKGGRIDGCCMENVNEGDAHTTRSSVVNIGDSDSDYLDHLRAGMNIPA